MRGRPKRKYDWPSLMGEVKRLLELSKKQGVHTSTAKIAKTLGVRHDALLEQMKLAGIQTPGQQQPDLRFQNRINELPTAELIGLHAQGAIIPSTTTTEEAYLHSYVVVAAFAFRGFSENRASKKVKPLIDDLLAPSFLSKDKMRVTEFEDVFSNLLSRLDGPHHPAINPFNIEKAIADFSEFRRHGYQVTIYLHGHQFPVGILQDMASRCSGDVDLVVWENPIKRLLGGLVSVPLISSLGPGFFPLLGRLDQRLREALADHSPTDSFTYLCSENDLHTVLGQRLQVCDALAEAGLLYGVPEDKAVEMAENAETTISRRLVAKDIEYGDGLNALEQERPLTNVVMGSPVRIPPKYLQALPLNGEGTESFMKIQKIEFGRKEVDCLTTWQPEIFDMLRRALRNPKFNDLHAKWIAAQERAIADCRLEHHRELVEIINPEGTMVLEGLAPAPSAKIFVGDRMAVGMLLSAYDADSLVGRIISLRDWRTCRDIQKRWSDEVLVILHKNVGTIVAGAKWDNIDQATEAFYDYLAQKAAYRSRLVRFIIEQAAVNFAKALWKTSQKMGIAGWDQLDAPFPELLQVQEAVVAEMEHVLPVVGIRLDYLLQGHSEMLRHRLRLAAEGKEQQKGLVDDYFEQVSGGIPDLSSTEPEDDDW